jgi:hypothetical protein
MPFPVAEKIELSGEERRTLERWARRPTSAQALAQRSRVVLAAARDRPADGDQVAQSVG